MTAGLRRDRFRPAKMTVDYALTLPKLSTTEPACFPLVNLWDNTSWHARQARDVRRQMDALCARCPLSTRCEGLP